MTNTHAHRYRGPTMNQLQQTIQMYDTYTRKHITIHRYRGITMKQLQQAIPRLQSIREDIAEILEIEGVYQVPNE